MNQAVHCRDGIFQTVHDVVAIQQQPKSLAVRIAVLGHHWAVYVPCLTACMLTADTDTSRM